MTTVRFEVKGAEELIRKLGSVATMRTLLPAMRRSVFRVHKDIATYPEPPASGSFKGFVRDKQRRWFFAALRRGDITVPYVRTGTLGRRWTTNVAASLDGLVGTIGNNTDYGPFVQSTGQQAQIHRGRWETIDKVLADNKQAIERDFKREIDRALAGTL